MWITYFNLYLIIAIEIAIVALLVLVVYGYKIYFTRKSAQRDKDEAEVNLTLFKAVEAHTVVNLTTIPVRQRKLDILLPLIEQFDLNLKENPSWQANREHLLKDYVVKQARKNASRRDWVKRLWSVYAFDKYCTADDYPLIEKLIIDRRVIVSLHACDLAVKTQDKNLVMHVLRMMASYRRYSQTLILQIFKSATPVVTNFIWDDLATEEDPYVRMCCYKIMREFHPNAEHQTYVKDLESNITELTIAALKYKVFNQEADAHAYLNAAIKNPHWQIRTIAAAELRHYHDASTISLLKNAEMDPVWWVRNNAQSSLTHILNQQGA